VVYDPELLKRLPTGYFLPYNPTGLTLPPPTIDNQAERCKHPLKRSFTFSTGKTITLCPDCGKATGHSVTWLDCLRLDGTIPGPTREYIAFYNLRLKELALSLSAEWAMQQLKDGYQLCNDCGEIAVNGDFVCSRRDGHYTHQICDPTKKPLDLSEDAYRISKSWLRGDLSYFADAEEQDGTGRVNTAGWVGTDHEGSRADYCSRDARAKQRRRERGVAPTKNTCAYCDGEFSNRANTDTCCENCGKRYSEEKRVWEPWIMKAYRVGNKLALTKQLKGE
jgi:hypothetical protein